jgi:acetyl esterase
LTDPNAVSSARGEDIDPEVRRFVRDVKAAYAAVPGFASLSYPERRQVAERVRAKWRAGGPTMARTQDLRIPTRHGGVRARLHDPGSSGPPRPVMVYLHGGGWTIFSIDTHDRLMREYAARAGIAVIGVDYALSPEHRFPIALEQIVDVVQWVGENAPATGVSAERIALGGDSAGGNLTVAACLSLRDAGSGGLVRAMLLNYAALDTECSAEACARYGVEGYMLLAHEMKQFWDNYADARTQAQSTLVSPLRARLEGLPQALLVIPECDVLTEQSVAMAARLRAAGVATEALMYEGATHSFLEAMSISALSNRALDDTARWLKRALVAPS